MALRTLAFLSAGSLVVESYSPGVLRPRSAMRMSTSDERSASAGSADATRRGFVSTTATGAAALTGVTWLPSMVPDAMAKKSGAWTPVDLGIQETLYDISFDPKDKDHGYVVGAKGTFFETKNGGKSWTPRSFSNLDADEEINYRFEKVSCLDDEVWIIGKPAILLHSKDAGKAWERVPLSPKLPGEPNGIIALGSGEAEMTTSTGAIYSTANAGRNWKALVKETIDATLNRISSSGVSGASYFSGGIINIARDQKGTYIAVSSRGNFYLTWTPGDDFWIPHNRGTPRRIQNMGFVADTANNGIWMSLNGGLLQIATGADLQTDNPDFKPVAIKTGGYGIIDLGWKDKNEIWAVGGGGTMYVSKDAGKTFKFDNSADDLPGNLYQVKFSQNNGFVLGSDGVLLRYAGAV